MGRDRAKEKLQAHKKARLERKEAKTEQKELDKKNQKNPKGVKVQNFKDLLSRGDDGDHVAGRGSSEGGDCAGVGKGDSKRPSVAESQISSSCSSVGAMASKVGTVGNAEGGDFGTCSATSENSDTLTLSPAQVPHIVSGSTKKEGKGKNAVKSFTACPNPNRGKIRPIWRLALEDAAIDRSKKSVSKSKKRPKVQEYSLLDLLKASECRTLKELLDVATIDEISHEVAAVALGRFDLIKKLLNDGYFSERRIEGKEFTPMNCAIQQNNWEMIEFLVDKSLCIHCKDKFQNTPLIKAVLQPDWTAQLMNDLWIMYKYDEKTDLTSSNKAGVNFIHGLAYRGWYEVLNDVLQFMAQQKRLKLQIPDLVNAQIWNGFTCLTIAVVAENLNICEILLSNGASAFVEDKAGFTPLCHAIYLSSRVTPVASERENLHPIFLHMASGLKLEDFTVKSFVAARFNSLSSPPSESVFVDLFYLVGRPLFSFIVRWIYGGAEMLLNSKIFIKLSATGLRHFQRKDFIHALCSVIFETLVFAEDHPSLWPKFVKAFMNEGGAEFCLRVLQRYNIQFNIWRRLMLGFETTLDMFNRPQCDINDYIGSTDETKDKCRASSNASVSDLPKSQDIADVPESMGFLVNSPPQIKNLGLAAVLPLVQVIDSSEMFSWFEKHFKCVSRCYIELMSKGLIDLVMDVSLPREHLARTRQKALLFSNLMFREKWINPNDLMSRSYIQPSDSRKPRKHKKVLQPLPRRVRVVPERVIRVALPENEKIIFSSSQQDKPNVALESGPETAVIVDLLVSAKKESCVPNDLAVLESTKVALRDLEVPVLKSVVDANAAANSICDLLTSESETVFEKPSSVPEKLLREGILAPESLSKNGRLCCAEGIAKHRYLENSICNLPGCSCGCGCEAIDSSDCGSYEDIFHAADPDEMCKLDKRSENADSQKQHEEEEIVNALELPSKLNELCSSPQKFKDDSLPSEERIIPLPPLYPIPTNAFQEENCCENQPSTVIEPILSEVSVEPCEHICLAVITDSNCQTVLHPMTIRAQRFKVERTEAVPKVTKRLKNGWLSDDGSTKRRLCKVSMYAEVTSRVSKIYRRKRIGLLFQAEKASISKSKERFPQISASVVDIVGKETNTIEWETKPSSCELSSSVSEDDIIFREKTKRSVRVQARINSTSCHTGLST